MASGVRKLMLQADDDESLISKGRDGSTYGFSDDERELWDEYEAGLVLCCWGLKPGHVVFWLAMFALYFWFGILKVVGISPAEAFIENMYNDIPLNFLVHFIPAEWFNRFIVGLSEVIMAVWYLTALLPFRVLRYICTWISIIVGVGHLVTVSLLPLFIVPGEIFNDGAWTLKGQYVFKNVVLLAGFIMVGFDLTNPAVQDSLLGPRFSRLDAATTS